MLKLALSSSHVGEGRIESLIPDGLGSHGGMEEMEGPEGEGALSAEVNRFEANYPWQPCPQGGDGWRYVKIISNRPHDGGGWYPAGNLLLPLPQLWKVGEEEKIPESNRTDRKSVV